MRCSVWKIMLTFVATLALSQLWLAGAQPTVTVDVKRDVVYGSANGIELKLDVYKPSLPGPLPAIIFVHGPEDRTGPFEQLVLMRDVLTTLDRQAISDNSNRYGVNASAGRRPDILGFVTDLDGRWMRVNYNLDGNAPDFKSFLEGGVNLVITIANRDLTNIDTTYGTLGQWPNAGFPFRSKSLYQQRLKDLLTPLLPYLAQGRQVWVQCENEIGDVMLNPQSRYWRGTNEQYLMQLQAFYEARSEERRVGKECRL